MYNSVTVPFRMYLCFFLVDNDNLGFDDEIGFVLVCSTSCDDLLLV